MYYIKTQQWFIWKFLNKNFSLTILLFFFLDNQKTGKHWRFRYLNKASCATCYDNSKALLPSTYSCLQWPHCNCQRFTIVLAIEPTTTQVSILDIRYPRVWFWNNFHRYWTIVYCLFSTRMIYRSMVRGWKYKD